MKNNRQYLIDLWLFIGSIVVLLYILFMNYAYINNWDNTVLIAIMELITIPLILLGCVIPVAVVYRHILLVVFIKPLKISSVCGTSKSQTFKLVGFILRRCKSLRNTNCFYSLLSFCNNGS